MIQPYRFQSISLHPQAWFTELEWAREFLLKYDDKLEKGDKFAIEILATYIFGATLKELGKPIFGIGFPVKDLKKEIDFEDYSDIVNSIKEDSDIDTILLEGVEEELSVLTLQVIRYIRDHLKTEEELLDYLRKRKLGHYGADNGLHLLVWVESTYDMNFRKISESLQREAVPFGSIVAVGHKGAEIDKTFACIKLFPELEGPVVIDLSKLNNDRFIDAGSSPA